MTSSLNHLSDANLIAELGRLVSQSNTITADLLVHIGETDCRRLYADAACSSMFSYCVEVLGLSEAASYKRIHAARAARRFPALLTLLATGKLHLCGIVLLAPHLTKANHLELLQAASGKSKRQIAIRSPTYLLRSGNFPIRLPNLHQSANQ